MNIDNLVDDILTKRHEPDSNEDPELYAYIKNIFEKYHAKYITDKIYQIAITPNFRYWIDKSSDNSDDYKLVWTPKHDKFLGVFEIKKKTVVDKLGRITNRWNSDFMDIKNKTTPLEWMAAKMSGSNFRWDESFSSKFGDLFWCRRSEKSENKNMFNMTVVAALDVSMKLFKDGDYTKIAI